MKSASYFWNINSLKNPRLPAALVLNTKFLGVKFLNKLPQATPLRIAWGLYLCIYPAPSCMYIVYVCPRYYT